MKAFLLEGPALQKALESTERQVQLRDADGHFSRFLSPPEAADLLMSGMCSAWGKNRRVRFLLALTPEAITWRAEVKTMLREHRLPFVECMRTAWCATLQPGMDWVEAMYPSERLARVAA